MENWLKYTKSLILNDKVFTAKKLLNIDISKLPDWEKDFYFFIHEWLSEKEYITVKTSGSTGEPKSINISKNTFVNSALNTALHLELKQNDKALLCLPGSYIAGKMMIVRAFVSKFRLYWQKPSSIPNINQYFDFAAMTPMQIQNIVSTNKNSLNLVEKMIIGGAPVSNQLTESISDLSCLCYETYGMTETASHIALKPINGPEKSDYFSVLDSVKIDLDNRNCLVIRSPYLLIDKLITNDIVEIKEMNQFKWLGRIDNIINSGGIKLIPEEIEAKLKTIIKKPFFIASEKDILLSNKIVLIIESKIKLEEIDFNKFLTKFEIPKKTYYLSSFIRTKSGKINRKETTLLLKK